MAVCIEYPIKDDAIFDGDIKISDFAVIGFKIIDDKKSCLLFYLSDDSDNVYMIQNTFEINDNDKVFFNNPINNLMNIDKLSDRDKEGFDKIINDMADNKCYYSSFKVSEIKDNAKTIVCLASHTSDNQQHKINFEIPFSIFVRLQILKNRMIFNIPMDVYIDQNEKFNGIKFHRGCTVDYFGCDPGQASVLALYVLKDAIQKKIGIASPVPALKRIITTKIVPKEKFTKLFPDTFLVNMTKIIIMDWLDNDNNPCKMLCVYIIDNDQVSIYMINGNPSDNVLMKPYDMIYQRVI